MGAAGFFGTVAVVRGAARTVVGGAGGGLAGGGALGRRLGDEFPNETELLRPVSVMPLGDFHRLGSGGVKSSGGRFSVATDMNAPQMRAG